MKNASLRNYGSAVDYVNRLHDHYPKLMALRVDLSYEEEYAQEITHKEANQDMSHLLNNKRSKPSVFRHCVGHLAHLERGEKKGPHFHALFFYDGSKVEKDIYYAMQIGEYWKGRITGGRGLYFNCNAKKSDYEKCGIGLIRQDDEEKRRNLLVEVVPYLTKADQSIGNTKEGNERCFRKGIVPKRKSNAGRPRG